MLLLECFEPCYIDYFRCLVMLLLDWAVKLPNYSKSSSSTLAEVFAFFLELGSSSDLSLLLAGLWLLCLRSLISYLLMMSDWSMFLY